MTRVNTDNSHNHRLFEVDNSKLGTFRTIAWCALLNYKCYWYSSFHLKTETIKETTWNMKIERDADAVWYCANVT